MSSIFFDNAFFFRPMNFGEKMGKIISKSKKPKINSHQKKKIQISGECVTTILPLKPKKIKTYIGMNLLLNFQFKRIIFQYFEI